jgi:hypothetical protein
MPRRTKIVTTLGPAAGAPGVIAVFIPFVRRAGDAAG